MHHTVNLWTVMLEQIDKRELFVISQDQSFDSREAASAAP